jgi:NAD(P)-dependent dehydrogenase (short-subunit alcohol dehydrogenase family)
VKAIGINVRGVQGDVAQLADLDRLYETVSKVKGRIDIVFANAGIGEFVPFGAVTEEHFDKLFNINVRGALFTVQKALPLPGPIDTPLANRQSADVVDDCVSQGPDPVLKPLCLHHRHLAFIRAISHGSHRQDGRGGGEGNGCAHAASTPSRCEKRFASSNMASRSSRS